MEYYYDDNDYNDLQQDDDYDGDYMEENGQYHLVNHENYAEVFDICILPSMKQILDYIAILLGWSLLYRLLGASLVHFKLKYEWLHHFVSTLCGLSCLYCAVGWKVIILIFPTLAAYTLMLLIELQNAKNIGLIMAFCTIASHFLFEVIWPIPETWHLLRGTQMVITMKIISLSFDVEAVDSHKKLQQKTTCVPNLMTYMGYIFCPPTCILGPWIPFSVYLKSQTPGVTKIKWKWKWIFWSLTNIMAALIFVSLSNCVSLLVFNGISLKWLLTLREAFAIRCSHYFICFLSQAAVSVGNINLYTNELPNPIFGHMISKPWLIEFPQSLGSLIRNWNIPMHKWLKAYVFQATLKRTQKYFIALLVTFLVSSLLHGMHLRIYFVLISLGLFAYVENLLRLKLAEVFNACLTSSYCKKPCSYLYCRHKNIPFSIKSLLVFINLIFSFLAIFHLAYLGVMLNTTGNELEDLALSPGFKRWQDLDFLSHIVSLIMYLFYCII